MNYSTLSETQFLFIKKPYFVKQTSDNKEENVEYLIRQVPEPLSREVKIINLHMNNYDFQNLIVGS